MIRVEEARSPGARIRVARKQRGWTQEALADAVGVSRSAIAQWETDRAGQIRANLARLARALGVTVEQLLFGGGGDMMSSVTASDRELTMLRLFRECDADDQDVLLRTARRFAGDAVDRLEADHPLALPAPEPPKDR